MNEIQFSEVVATLCKHHKNYTPNGTFVEVSIFLEGFAMGAKVGGLKHRDCHSKFTPFFRWLADKKGRKQSVNPWEDFRGEYSDDIDALNGLANLYREYAESVIGTNDEM